jgi:hypothetical protein
VPVAATGSTTAVLSNGQVLVAGGARVATHPGGPPSIATTAAAGVYSPPAGTGTGSGARPAGAPLAVVAAPSSSTLAVALGSAGGAVLLAGLALWGYERRRRRLGRPHPVR